MNSTFLIFALTLGILILKAIWLATDKTPLRRQLMKSLLISNGIELFILGLQAGQAIFSPFPPTNIDFAFTYIGLFLYCLGIVFMVWGRLVMNNGWGYPGTVPIKLFTSGPFTFSRNPLYVGWLFLYFGYAIALRTPFIILRIPLVIYFYKSIKEEEKYLEKTFGRKYTVYKSRTPRFLFI